VSGGAAGLALVVALCVAALGQAQGRPSGDVPLAQAQLLVRYGKLEEALPRVRAYLKRHPDSADGHALLGFILFKQSKPAEALREYSEASKHRAPTAFEFKIAALCYAMQEDYENAGRWLARSLELNPRDLQACNDLGEIEFLRERYEESIGVFRKCLALDAKNAFAENGIGSACEQMRRFEDAAAAYRNAIAWQAPEAAPDPTPILNLGRVLLKQNKPEEALVYLTRAVELSPREASALEQLGKAHSYVRDLASAQAELEKASRLDPGNAQLHYVLGRLYRSAGLEDKAADEFQRFRALKRPADGAPERP